MKYFKKLIALVLILSLIITTIPFGIVADSNVKLGLQTSLSENETISDGEPELLYELVEKRDAVTKHFLMSDGTIKACVYPEAVHYKDGTEYLEIDNTLIESKQRGKSYYQNKANSFKAILPENSNDYIEFSDENGFVKFKLVGALNTPIKKQTASLSKSSNKTVLENKHSRAVYKSVKADVDIQYDIIGNRLKETIILKNKSDRQSFVFEILTSASSAVKNDDNSISFYNTENEEIYTIESPYMQDSNGEFSYAIETTLQKTDTGYTLAYNPDYNWLSDKNRTYPVYIDPTIFESADPDGVFDTYVDSAQSANSSKCAYYDYIRVGAYSNNSNRYVRRAYYKFELPSQITSNDIIVNANLILLHSSNSSLNAMTLDLHNVTSSWQEHSLLWTNQPSYDPLISDFTQVSSETISNGYVTLSYDSFDITKLAKGWHNRSIANNGVMIKSRNENVSGDYNQVEYYSKDILESHPLYMSNFIQITYRSAVGLEDYWSYSSVNVSEYGTGYVNNYSGAMTFVAPITSMSTNTGSLSLSLIYNAGNAKWERASTANKYRICGLYGNGWRLNLVQTIKDYTEQDNLYEYIYTDGDGTQHYFIETEDGIKDEDGLGLTLTTLDETVDNGATHLTVQITSTDKKVMKFDSSGYLRRITDDNGNTVSLNYSPADDYSQAYLTSASLPSGKAVEFEYEVVGGYRRLKALRNFKGDLIGVAYNEENLYSINHPEEACGLWFTYDRAKLVKARMPEGISINFTYKLKYPNNPDTSHYSLADSVYSTYYGNFNNIVRGEGYTLDYSDSKTVVTNTSGRKITYQFDTFGRTTGVYDDQGNICTSYYNLNSTQASEIFKNNKLSAGSYVFRYAENLLKNQSFNNSLNSWTVWGEGNQYSVTASTHTGIIDKAVAEVSVNNAPSDAGIKQTISTRSQREYTLSAHVFPVNVVSEDKGAALEVVTSLGRVFYSDYITGTSDVNKANKGYKQLDLTFTLTSDETISYVGVGLFNAVGKIYVDALQLEVGNTVNPINLIEDSSFEDSSSVSYTAFHASKSIRLGAGTPTRDYYSIPGNGRMNGSKGDILVVGCALNMDYVSDYTENIEAYVGMEIHFDGDDVKTYFVDINPYASGWHWISKAIVAPFNYTTVYITLKYYDAANYAYFDSLFFYKDIAQCYTYDSDGNVISTYDFAEGEQSFNYQNGNMAKLVSPNGSSYEYEYSGSKLLNAKSASGVGYRFGYDLESGNPSPEVAQVQADRYSTPIEKDKVYYIRSRPTGENIQTYTGTFAEGNYISTYTAAGYNFQKWTLRDAENGYFYIESAESNYRLGVKNGSAIANQPIELTTSTGNKAKFKIVPDSSGIHYYIVPKLNSDMVLCTDAGALDTYDQIILAPLSENRQDKYWYFVETETSEPLYWSKTPQDNKIYYIHFRHNFFYLDIPVMRRAEGTPVIQYPLNADVNQQFLLTATSNGYFKISPMHTTDELFFTLVPNSDGTGVIQLFAENGTAYQEFKFIDAPGESYRVVCKASPNDNYAIQISGASNNYSEPLTYGTCLGYGEPHQILTLEDAGDIIRTSVTYTDDLDFVSTVTDSRGNTESYTYYADGALKTVTDAKGNTSTYSYYLTGQLRSVNSGDDCVFYTYNKHSSRVSRILGNNVDYQIQYDNYGRKTLIQNCTGDQYVTFSRINYKDTYSSLIGNINYNNGTEVVYLYDEYDRLITQWIGSQQQYYYTYDSYNRVKTYTDHFANVTETYSYDLAGRVSQVKSSTGHTIVYDYDKYNRLDKTEYTLNGTEFNYSYSYGDTEQGQKIDLLYGLKLNGEESITYTYDELNRVKTKTIHTDTPYVIEYTYYDGAVAGTTSELVKTVKIGNDVYGYFYDNLGNITRISKNDDNYKAYLYDNKNQLTQESNITDDNLLRGYYYSYDLGGNITYVDDNDSGKSYIYGNANWKDQLTQYKGQTLTYDQIGNPLNYRDGYVFTWSNGRKLYTVSKNGTAVANYIYNGEGLRQSKTVNGVTTEYCWFGGLLQYQKTGSEYIYFLYDESGMPYGMLIKNGTQESYYYYIYNLQGEILRIVDQSGAVVVEYTYNAWGEILATTGTLANTIGQSNPIRYKSYYYDTETGFYYLNSRYYDPILRRFVNADGQINSGFLGNNMFAYCENNPVNLFDPNGDAPASVIIPSLLSGNSEYNLLDLVRAKKAEIKQEQLELIGFKNIDYESAEKYMATIRNYNINTAELEAHFLSQCAYESEFGQYLTEYGSTSYFSGKPYGYKYRGGGYLQLTWDYNYQDFADYIGDNRIMQGADFVAKNYAWESAGWFWNKNNINGCILNGGSVKDVTRIVKGSSGTWKKRQEYYNNIISILG